MQSDASILFYFPDLLAEARELQKKAEEELSKCRGKSTCRIESELLHEKTNNLGLRPGPTQTCL